MKPDPKEQAKALTSLLLIALTLALWQLNYLIFNNNYSDPVGTTYHPNLDRAIHALKQHQQNDLAGGKGL